MYTITPVLDTRRQLNNGMYPIKLRITCQKRSHYIHINLFVNRKHWDKTSSRVRSSHPNSKLYNQKISTCHLDVEQKVMKADIHSPIQSIQQIRSLLEKDKKPSNFIAYGRELVQTMKDSGRYGNARSYNQAINKLESYLKSSKAPFQQLNHALLRNWEASMKKDGIKQNSIASYYRAIRAICNQAIKDDLMPQSWYPFKHFKIRTESTKDRSLSLDELRALYNIKPQTSKESWAKDLFFLSFALIGMNFTDMAYLRPENIKNGRVNYKRKKTGKRYSIYISKMAHDIMQRMDGSKDTGYLIPILIKGIPIDRHHPHITQELKNCNTALKALGKRCGLEDISTYYARYTWVNLASELGASKSLISDALGHSRESVTDIYIKDHSSKDIDKINRNIQNSVTGSFSDQSLK